MSDFQDYSHLVPPANRRKREQWFLDQEERILRKTRDGLVKVITESTEKFIGTLTASGDMTVFDAIPVWWAMYVEDQLIEELQGMFLSGGLSVWMDGPIARLSGIADIWVEVLNQQAVDYALQATNRMADVGQTTWNLLKESVSKSIEQGGTVDELSELLKRNTSFSEYRAEVIARTETSTAYVNGSWEGMQALGEYGPTHKYWINTRDDRTRDSHLVAPANNGVIPVGQPFIVGGEEMMYPHAPGAPAKEVVQCRCDIGWLYPGDPNPFTGEPVPEPVPVA